MQNKTGFNIIGSFDGKWFLVSEGREQFVFIKVVRDGDERVTDGTLEALIFTQAMTEVSL